MQTALANTDPGDQIYVAGGVYKPGAARTSTFQLKAGVPGYGGFAGTAGDARDPALYQTVLSGDVDNNDSQTPVITNISTVTGNTTNAYHVVKGVAGATLDGVTVTAGYGVTTATTPSGRAAGCTPSGPRRSPS